MNVGYAIGLEDRNGIQLTNDVLTIGWYSKKLLLLHDDETKRRRVVFI